MRAIFCVPFPHEQSLPPMDELHYMDGKVLRGGYSCVGQVGKEAKVIVAVEASEVVLSTMAKDRRYTFLEDKVATNLDDMDTALAEAKVKPEEYERGKAWVIEETVVAVEGAVDGREIGS